MNAPRAGIAAVTGLLGLLFTGCAGNKLKPMVSGPPPTPEELANDGIAGILFTPETAHIPVISGSGVPYGESDEKLVPFETMYEKFSMPLIPADFALCAANGHDEIVITQQDFVHINETDKPDHIKEGMLKSGIEYLATKSMLDNTKVRFVVSCLGNTFSIISEHAKYMIGEGKPAIFPIYLNVYRTGRNVNIHLNLERTFGTQVFEEFPEWKTAQNTEWTSAELAGNDEYLFYGESIMNPWWDIVYTPLKKILEEEGLDAALQWADSAEGQATFERYREAIADISHPSGFITYDPVNQVYPNPLTPP